MRGGLACLLVGALVAGFAAPRASLAQTIPAVNLCDHYQRDLRQQVMLLGPWAPIDRGDIALASQTAERMCLQGEAAAGVAILREAIASLGLPPLQD